MQYGFHLYVDEAGDEGLERVRPLDPDGATEYFVLAGVLIRSHRVQELNEAVQSARLAAGIGRTEELHFRDLGADAQARVVGELASFRAGLVAIVSNKRNMRRYRNRRVEAKSFEVVRGRVRPQRHNWFYNHLFRYLLESASAECARWTKVAYGCNRPIRIIFSHRKHFRYSQTAAYLHKLRVARHGPDYFNNKRQITWPVVDPSGLISLRGASEAGLQFADCVASAVFRALDQDHFGTAVPAYLEALAPRFVKLGATPEGHGFKLLPDGFRGPLSDAQRRGLRAVGVRL